MEFSFHMDEAVHCVNWMRNGVVYRESWKELRAICALLLSSSPLTNISPLCNKNGVWRDTKKIQEKLCLKIRTLLHPIHLCLTFLHAGGVVRVVLTGWSWLRKEHVDWFRCKPAKVCIRFCKNQQVLACRKCLVVFFSHHYRHASQPSFSYPPDFLHFLPTSNFITKWSNV